MFVELAKYALSSNIPLAYTSFETFPPQDVHILFKIPTTHHLDFVLRFYATFSTERFSQTDLLDLLSKKCIFEPG